MYNFAVADNHNYFVGHTGLLVHNDCIVAPAGRKLAQMIGRSGVSGGRAGFMKYAQGLVDEAAAAGSKVEGKLDYLAGETVTIYRRGNEFLAVAKDGTLRSYVKNPSAGWGIEAAYRAAGGK